MKIDKHKIIWSPLIAKNYIGKHVWFFETICGVGLKYDILTKVEEDAIYPFIDSNGMSHRLITPFEMPMCKCEINPKHRYRLYNENELNRLVGKVVTRRLDGNNFVVLSYDRGAVYIAGLGRFDARELFEKFNLDGKHIHMDTGEDAEGIVKLSAELKAMWEDV
jgi:hypothetical protein